MTDPLRIRAVTARLVRIPMRRPLRTSASQITEAPPFSLRTRGNPAGPGQRPVMLAVITTTPARWGRWMPLRITAGEVAFGCASLLVRGLVCVV